MRFSEHETKEIKTTSYSPLVYNLEPQKSISRWHPNRGLWIRLETLIREMQNLETGIPRSGFFKIV